MSDRRTYRFDARDSVGVFLGLTPLQVAVGGGINLVCLFAMAAGMLPILVGLAVGVSGACLAFSRHQGRPLLPALVCWARFAFTDQHPWIAPISMLDPDQQASRLVMPPGLEGIDMIGVEGFPHGLGVGPVAVLHDTTTNRYAASLRIAGHQFSLIGEEDQERLLELWGEALAPFARERAGLVDVRWGEWAAPSGVNTQLAYLDAQGCKTPVPAARESYRQALAEAASAVCHEIVVTVVIAGDLVNVLAKHRGDRQAAAVDALLTRLRLFSVRLRNAELEVFGALSPGQTAKALRARLDPSMLDRLALRARDRESDDLPAGQAGPVTSEVRWEAVRYDGTWHAVLHIAEWPLSRVRAQFLRMLLLDGTCTRTVGLLYWPTSAREAYKAASIDQASVEMEGRTRMKHGFLLGQRLRKDAAAVEERQKEIVDGFVVNDYVGFVDVAAPTLEELEGSVEQIVQAALSCQVELRRLNGQHHLVESCVLPVPRGLTAMKGWR